MLRKFFIAAVASALALGAALPATAAAHPYDRGYRGGQWDGGGQGYYRDRGGYDRRDYGRGYYEGDRRSYRRCRNNGAAGTIIGAIAGGLLGNEIANGRYNDRDGTGGAIVGAGVGALAGRAIDRNC